MDVDTDPGREQNINGWEISKVFWVDIFWKLSSPCIFLPFWISVTGSSTHTHTHKKVPYKGKERCHFLGWRYVRTHDVCCKELEHSLHASDRRRDVDEHGTREPRWGVVDHLLVNILHDATVKTHVFVLFAAVHGHCMLSAKFRRIFEAEARRKIVRYVVI